MTEHRMPEGGDILHVLRRLEGTAFAGLFRPGIGGVAAECSCQNCGCDSRAGDSCSCNPRCSCQGYTADRMDRVLDPLLGLAAVLPLDDFKTLIDLRDKLTEAYKKQGK